MTSQPLARDVLAVIHRGCEGVVELRAIPARAQVFAPLSDPSALAAFVKAHADSQHLYFGVATRRDDTSGRVENCAQLGALFADIDFGKLPEDEARATLAACELPPGVVIHSGGGLHPYWPLETPLDVRSDPEACKRLLRRLAHRVGGDPVVAEPARVLRLPGTRNFKYDPPALVRVEVFEPSRRYALEELDAWLPALPVPASVLPVLPKGWTPPPATADRVERGRAYLRGMGPAIEGQGGDAHTFRAACWLTNDLALDEHDALMILREWNALCAPPWSDKELQEKVQHAKRYGRHPVGAALVDSPRPRTVRVVTVQVVAQ